MDEWIDRFADALGEDRITPRELGALLKLSRDVAHGVERKLAPVSTFVAGLHVGRTIAEGRDRQDALGEALAEAVRLLPTPNEVPGTDPS
jgi:Domain of unknown function (DUF6457)